ncbi:MAG: POTRA domain-containing protein, partial [bacterium]
MQAVDLRPMRHAIAVKLILVFLGLFFANSVRAQTEDHKTIRNIDIERQDVFPVITRKPHFLYDWANHLHVVTRERVILRELLFQKGDVYDAELLEESERNLRSLSYLGEVEISVKNEEKDSVDIQVTTQDQWSTLVSYFLESSSGRTVFGGGLDEFNFIGFGKRVFTEIRHEVSEGTRFTIRYTDPQLFFSRWTTEELFVSGPFTKTYSANIVRPFFSLDTRWAGGVSGSLSKNKLRLFEQGVENSRFKLDTGSFQVFGARTFGTRFRKARVQLAYRFLDREFDPIDGQTSTILPEDELIHALILSSSLERVSFAEETKLDKFIRTEDLTLGNITQVSLGRTGIPIATGVKRFELSVLRREAHKIFANQYLFLTLAFQTLFEKDSIASLRLQYYNRIFRNQTFAFNLEFDYSKNLESSRQFLLGGDSGLRAYPARAFAGDKRFLINVEDRIFTPVNILTVQLGGVLFADAGNVWPTG